MDVSKMVAGVMLLSATLFFGAAGVAHAGLSGCTGSCSSTKTACSNPAGDCCGTIASGCGTFRNCGACEK